MWLKGVITLKKIGLIIADESEYVIVREWAEKNSAERFDFYTREGHLFMLDDATKVHSVLCGIGTVNAATAATYLALEGVQAIFNFGLSGGISGISRGEFMVGTNFLEHDFDLTPLGYELCQKPSQKSVFEADKRLVNLICEAYPFIKQGVAVSGDSFICDDKRRDFFKNKYNAMSCDMESSAIAYVCDLANIPFLSLRKISDDAGNDANNSYKGALNIEGEEVLKILFEIMKKA